MMTYIILTVLYFAYVWFKYNKAEAVKQKKFLLLKAGLLYVIFVVLMLFREVTLVPFKYLEEFRHYEKEAREKHKGLWARWHEKDNVVNETSATEAYAGSYDENDYQADSQRRDGWYGD